MQQIIKRLSSLAHLARPLALAFIGIILLSLGATYFVFSLYHAATVPALFQQLTLQFLPRWVRGILFTFVGLVVLGIGIWRLSGVVVIPIKTKPGDDAELVLGYRRDIGPPRVVVLSGGPGMLILSSLGHQVARLTCITPVQDLVEYYYRASSLFNFENVYFVAPLPTPLPVEVELSDGSRHDIKHNIPHDESLALLHATNIFLSEGQESASNHTVSVTRLTTDTIGEADAIIFGPGSLFESILPNLLIPEVCEAIKQSKACKIYICNLMTEPGLTTGFSVADHIRQIVKFGGFAPDYVLVNAQRIDSEVRQIYEAANQIPVYLTPEEYEETIVHMTDRVTTHDMVLEGAVVIEADLASSVVQMTASLDYPGQNRTVRVLRHDPDKLVAAILEILRRTR